MIDYENPFEYEAANKFAPEQILDFYIEDFNYSRFIRSKRNIFLVGERGAGKTMTLKYNSFPVQYKKAEISENEANFDVLCVYVPCNTPLMHRREYELLERFQASVISEHFFVLTIMDSIIETISGIENLLEEVEENELKEIIEFTLDIEIPVNRGFFKGLRQAFQKIVVMSQRKINNPKEIDVFYEDSISFTSGVLPLISCLKSIPKLEKSHFALMLDDAHDLNKYQIRSLNSWIAYRDNTMFSFKVAMAKIGNYKYKTSTGGTILDGHDFTFVDMERPYQNKDSDFGKLARNIVQRRLQKLDIEKTPDKFFPVNPSFEKDIEKYRKIVREEAKKKFPNGSEKQISDYVYKYHRARYFQDLSRRANIPPYSGFEMLVHLSTGVIRNLLEPCYWMYDRVISDEHSKNNSKGIIDEIPPPRQNDIIMERSKRKWDWIRDGLDKSIEDCSSKQAKQLFQLFDNLAILYRDRLLHHKSEPRAIKFSISNPDFEYFSEIENLLIIAHKAQILYEYSSSAKDKGRREKYYVLNRILLPDRKLDPHGQHATVSIKAQDLWAAATRNKEIPSNLEDKEEDATRSLFDE